MTDPGPRPLSPHLNKIIHLYTYLTIYNSTSNSGNVTMPIKFNFLINPESIQSILKYVSRLCINNNVRKTIPYCDNSITKKNFYINFNAYVLIAFIYITSRVINIRQNGITVRLVVYFPDTIL